MEKKSPNWFLRTFDIRMWFFDFVKWTAFPFLWLLLRTKLIYIDGKKPKGLKRGKFILASNHVSKLDPFVAASTVLFRRMGWVAKETMFKKPYGWFFRAISVIELNKEKLSTKTFRKVNNLLTRGHILCMFPEGSISEDELKTFKSGVVMMAAMSKADILPIYLANRKTFVQRKVAVIGNRLKYEDLFKSPIPNKEEINKASILLMEKEKELENKYKELYENR